MGKKLEAPPDFEGPTGQRQCTDIFCTVLLMATWIAMTALGLYAWRAGDYRIILHPMDYDGNICGIEFNGVDMTDYPRIVYINSYGGGVCVKECPSIPDSPYIDTNTFITFDGLYQGEDAFVSADDIQIADYSNAENVRTCDEDSCPTNIAQSWTSSGVGEGKGFAFYAVDTMKVFGTRCLANPLAIDQLEELTDVNRVDLEIEAVSEIENFLGNLYGDIYQARNYIFLFGFLASVVLAFTYSQLLRFPAVLSIMVWSSVFATIGIIFATGGYAYRIQQEWDAEEPQVRTDTTISATKWFSYILFVIGFIVVFLTIALRKQIQLAMACVKASGRAVASMPLVIAFPILQASGFAVFLAVWIYYAVHLASMGEVKVHDYGLVTTRTYELTEFTKNAGWFLLFCFFWTSQFILALGEIILAMCFAKWYFTRDKRQIGSSTICTSVAHTLRFHIGTAAFGSLLIAIIQMIRAIIAKMQKKAREMDSKVAEALLCCCQCCFACFEKFMAFLNKNAYIQTAIFGTPFCRSAREAFTLIIRNAGKIGSISFVSAVVLFVGKLFISCLTAGIAYMYIDYELGTELYSLAGPTLIIFCMAYFVGDMFLDIFEMSTETILQCFIADEEMFDGDECYADRDLREWLSVYEENERKIILT